MKSKVSILVILFSLVLMCCTVSVSAASPAVDGFIGVPWGASRQQVRQAMEERGFTLLEQRADGIIDTYQGTFTGQPAELKFQYESNVFFSGEANFLHVKGQSLDAVRAYYMELKGLLTAKYGLPAELTDAAGKTPVCLWERLPATATPPGQVTIQARYGQVFYGTGYLGNGLYKASGVTVSYSIGSSWARQKAVKDIKDI